MAAVWGNVRSLLMQQAGKVGLVAGTAVVLHTVGARLLDVFGMGTQIRRNTPASWGQALLGDVVKTSWFSIFQSIGAKGGFTLKNARKLINKMY